MANVELKTDFKDGEVLFGEQLNNNFKAIKAALEAANKIAWQDNLDDEIVAFKGTTEEVEHRPIINGQLVYDVKKAITYIDIITYSEEEGYPTLKPQRINLTGGVKTISEGDLSDILEPGIYLVKPGSSVTDNKGTGADIKDARHYDSVLIVGKHNIVDQVWQTLERGFSKFYRDIWVHKDNNNNTVNPWQKYEGPEGPQGPQGPQGPEGPEGPQGEPGKDGVTPDMSDYYTKDEITSLNFINKTLLYENGSGVSSDLILNEACENFEYIEIFAVGNASLVSCKLPINLYKTASFYTTGASQMYHCTVTLSGKNLTFTQNRQIKIADGNVTTSAAFKVVQVIGYNRKETV